MECTVRAHTSPWEEVQCHRGGGQLAFSQTGRRVVCFHLPKSSGKEQSSALRGEGGVGGVLFMCACVCLIMAVKA